MGQPLRPARPAWGCSSARGHAEFAHANTSCGHARCLMPASLTLLHCTAGSDVEGSGGLVHCAVQGPAHKHTAGCTGAGTAGARQQHAHGGGVQAAQQEDVGGSYQADTCQAYSPEQVAGCRVGAGQLVLDMLGVNTQLTQRCILTEAKCAILGVCIAIYVLMYTRKMSVVARCLW